MTQPQRAGRWMVMVTLVAALLFVSWPTFWGAVGIPLRELGADALEAGKIVAILLFFLTANNVKQRSRRGGGGTRDDHPHD